MKKLTLVDMEKCLVAFASFAMVLVVFVVSAAAQTEPTAKLKPTVRTAVRFDISPPLRSMKNLPPPSIKKPEYVMPDDRGGFPKSENKHDPDPALQGFFGEGVFNRKTSDAIPPTTTQFAGIGQASGPTPPDTVGDVGPNHYVQMVNSRFQVFNKATGASVFGPININTLWAGFGGPCQTQNAGDPVVLYDQFADRWLLTQFTSTGPNYFNCVALSQTNDPAGAYFRWAFPTGTNFPDYPKFGVWSDGYYIANREFSAAGPFAGMGVYALNRDQMLLGNASPQVVSFLLTPGGTPYVPGDGILPPDIDGNVLPPAGAPAYFLGSQDQGGPYGAPVDALNLFKFAVNWTLPANSTFTLTNTIPMATMDTIFPCTPSSRACIAQPGTTAKLDILSYRQRPMHRLAYRNFGTHESLVTNQSVEAQTGIAGIRWWEVRSPNASPTIFQQGTYSPDTTHRWMGSIAQDRQGNMLLGYSVSDGVSVFPSIRYTGRLVGDPADTLPQGEGTMIAGAGVQTSTGSRWGDYSSMNVDPVDDCTFWYTTEYYAATSTSGWATRIGSVKYPGCSATTAANVSVSGFVRNDEGRGIGSAIVRMTSMASTWSLTVRTRRNGAFTFPEVPVGDTYVVSVQARRYTFAEPSRVLNLQDNVTDFNFVANSN